MKILAIGHPDAVLGFSLAGISGQVATTAQEVKQSLAQAMATPDVGIVLITDDVAQFIEDQLNQMMLRSTRPLVIEIPGPEGMRAGRPSLSEVIQKTIGIRM
ncbi:MAG: V-type ATP synthase subunit F [Anaerolineae bacterium]|nr:V-type ATP synthase subunit F [Anaerolineae bacterium]